jgi:endonuclease YncB( thermonuclease family)
MKAEILILTVLGLVAVFYISSFTGLFVGLPTTHATRIIDGDTIEVSGQDGPESVRLIGIDTPEKGQFLFEEAKERLEKLIGGREILLQPDETDRDKYGRLLRYVFLNRTELVNIMLVREGLATALIYPPDDEYEKELLEAEAEARNRGIGLWDYMEIPDVFCIGIFYFKYNAIGDDRENLNDEYIEFRNKCEYAVEMTGWTVDDRAGHSYTFPEFTAQAKTKFKLHTGKGTDGQASLYWGSSMPVWNNGGDEMRMEKPDGQLVLEYVYKGYS